MNKPCKTGVLLLVFSLIQHTQLWGQPDAFERGYAAFEAGEYLNAIEYYNIFLEKKFSINALFNRGLSYFEIGLYDKAIEDYNAILREDSTDFEAYFNRGLAYMELADYISAQADFENTLALNPDYTKAYTFMGLARYHLGDYKEAIGFFNKGKESDILSAANYYNRALAYQAMGETAKAETDFKMAVKLEPKAAYFWGYANLLFNNKDYQASVEAYNQAISLNPEEPKLWFNRGISKYEQKQYALAIEDFMAASQIDPEDLDAHWYLALSYKAIGDFEKALHHYEAVEFSNPHYQYLWAINKSELKIRKFLSRNFYYMIAIVLMSAVAITLLLKILTGKNTDNPKEAA
jgi:tetratricopeptide (TPR) repeat protein